MSTLALDQSYAHSELRLSRRWQWRMFLASLVVGDAWSISLAFTLAFVIRYHTNWLPFDDVQPAPQLLAWLPALLLLGWLGVFAAFRLYSYQYLLGGMQEYARVFSASAVALSLIVLITFFVPFVRISRGWLSVAWVLTFLLVWANRFLLRRAAYLLRRRGWLTRRTLIVGADDEAAAIAQQLQAAPTAGAQVIGFVTNGAPPTPGMEATAPALGAIQSLPALVKTWGVQELIISTAGLHRADLITIFESFANSEEVELRFSSGLYELFTAGVRVREIGRVPLVSMNRVRLDPLESFIKTISDLAVSGAGLLVQLPLIALIALLIKLDSPGPVFYRRRVLGRGGRQFDAFKFRTMYVNGSEILQQHPELLQELRQNFKLKDDPRITRVGKWLRRFSLDEIPQLWNILRGQMSLVGPRMITPEEAEKYGRLRVNLLTVKPGLTGLWQVKGRSDVSYEERVRLDMYYIRNYNLWLDVQILLQTVPVVLKGKGAY